MRCAVFCLVFAVSFALGSVRVLACECAEKEVSLLEEVQNSYAVLRGTIRSNVKDGVSERRWAEIDIQKAWKDPEAGRRTIEVTQLPGKQCDLYLEEGQDYLLFVVDDREHGALRVSTCGRSVRLDQAENLVRELDLLLPEATRAGAVSDGGHDLNDFVTMLTTGTAQDKRSALEMFNNDPRPDMVPYVIDAVVDGTTYPRDGDTGWGNVYHQAATALQNFAYGIDGIPLKDRGRDAFSFYHDSGTADENRRNEVRDNWLHWWKSHEELLKKMDDLILNVHTNQSSYDIGEPILLTLSWTNLSERDMIIYFREDGLLQGMLSFRDQEGQELMKGMVLIDFAPEHKEIIRPGQKFSFELKGKVSYEDLDVQYLQEVQKHKGKLVLRFEGSTLSRIPIIVGQPGVISVEAGYQSLKDSYLSQKEDRLWIGHVFSNRQTFEIRSSSEGNDKSQN